MDRGWGFPDSRDEFVRPLRPLPARSRALDLAQKLGQRTPACVNHSGAAPRFAPGLTASPNRRTLELVADLRGRGYERQVEMPPGQAGRIDRHGGVRTVA